MCGHSGLPHSSPSNQGCSLGAGHLRLATRTEPAVWSTIRPRARVLVLWAGRPQRAQKGHARNAPFLLAASPRAECAQLQGQAQPALIWDPVDPSVFPREGLQGGQGGRDLERQEGALNSATEKPARPTSDSYSSMQCYPSKLVRVFFALMGLKMVIL